MQPTANPSRPGPPMLVLASSIAPSDSSTSILLTDLTGPQAGFAVASIEYRTVLHGATYTDGVADVKAAVRYLRAHAELYRIDADRVALWGGSAGGYLVSLAGLTNGLAEFEVGAHRDQSSAAQAVVDKFGASDLARIADDFDGAARDFATQPDNPRARYAGVPAGGSVLTDPDAVAKANPINYVRPDAPPFLLLHGTADTIISPSQTLLLHTALRAAGVPSTRYLLEGANHGDLVFLGDPDAGLPWSTEAVMDRAVGFLRSRLAVPVSSPASR
ncbi:MAG TPA: alpha/beta hydrolase [Pseudonocardia sp.]|nr:alpha/beta hydrolase [Pseudonocardia sp.]